MIRIKDSVGEGSSPAREKKSGYGDDDGSAVQPVNAAMPVSAGTKQA